MAVKSQAFDFVNDKDNLFDAIGKKKKTSAKRKTRKSKSRKNK